MGSATRASSFLRGYVHVIGMPRGVGKSEGGGARTLRQLRPDRMDSGTAVVPTAMSAWSASRLGAEQLHVSRQQPPHSGNLSVRSARRLWRAGGFREEYPGGVIHLFRYLVGHFSAMHQVKGNPARCRPSASALARRDEQPRLPDVSHVYNLLAQKGQHMPPYFDLLIDPYDTEASSRRVKPSSRRSRCDLYRLGLVRLHIQDPSQRRAELFRQYHCLEKLMFRARAPRAAVSSFHHEILRWHALAQRHRTGISASRA